MRFSTTLALTLAALPLALADNEEAQQARTIASFWRLPNRQSYIGYINDHNLDGCFTIVRAPQVIGSAEIMQYPDRGFFCNLYADMRCSGDWITQITGYRNDLPGEGIYTRSARCFSYSRISDDDDHEEEEGDDSGK